MYKHVAVTGVIFIEESGIDSDSSTVSHLTGEDSSSEELTIIIDDPYNEHENRDSFVVVSDNYSKHYENDSNKSELNHLSQNSFSSESNEDHDHDDEYSSTQFELILIGKDDDCDSPPLRVAYNSEGDYEYTHSPRKQTHDFLPLGPDIMCDERSYSHVTMTSKLHGGVLEQEYVDLVNITQENLVLSDNDSHDLESKFKSKSISSKSTSDYPKTVNIITHINQLNGVSKHTKVNGDGNRLNRDFPRILGRNQSDTLNTPRTPRFNQKRGIITRLWERVKPNPESKYRVPDSSQSTQSLKSKKNRNLSSLWCCFDSPHKESKGVLTHNNHMYSTSQFIKPITPERCKQTTTLISSPNQIIHSKNNNETRNGYCDLNYDGDLSATHIHLSEKSSDRKKNISITPSSPITEYSGRRSFIAPDNSHNECSIQSEDHNSDQQIMSSSLSTISPMKPPRPAPELELEARVARLLSNRLPIV